MGLTAETTAPRDEVAAGAGRAERPLIGITTSEVRVAEQVELTPYGEPARREMALGLSYMRAVTRAGGLPVVIPPLPVEMIRPLLSRLDGLLLSGGPDIHPAAYGQAPHSELGPTWRDLDIAELALARQGVELRLPILAIARGAQALNVARGGTLFQHLPDSFGRTVQHHGAGKPAPTSHDVEIEPGSILARSMGCTRLEVNSYHHQSASGLGRGVRAVARAPDGVIEAIEVPDRTFVVGVQWHAESMVGAPAQLRLFRAFVEGASARAGGASARARQAASVGSMIR
jgi:putative glutamine amidotransferase